MPKPSPKDRARAEKWFRDKVPMTDDEANALSERAKAQAFWLSQVGDLRVADMVLKSLRRAIEFGEDLDEWKRKIGGALRAAWGPGRRDRAGRVFDQGFRLETIYRNAVQTAHNTARFHQLRKHNVMALRPYWKFVAERPTEFPHPTCTALNGTVRMANDPWWNTVQPPLHHRCQSGVKALTQREAQAAGITDELPTERPDDGFGQPATDATTALTNTDLSTIDRELRALFESKTRFGPR